MLNNYKVVNEISRNKHIHENARSEYWWWLPITAKYRWHLFTDLSSLISRLERTMFLLWMVASFSLRSATSVSTFRCFLRFFTSSPCTNQRWVLSWGDQSERSIEVRRPIRGECWGEATNQRWVLRRGDQSEVSIEVRRPIREEYWGHVTRCPPIPAHLDVEQHLLLTQLLEQVAELGLDATAKRSNVI